MDIKELLAALAKELDQPEEKKLYSPKEAAKILGREASTIRDWIRMERVKSERRGRNVFIPHDELMRLKNSHCELASPNWLKVPPSLRPKFSASQSVAS